MSFSFIAPIRAPLPVLQRLAFAALAGTLALSAAAIDGPLTLAETQRLAIAQSRQLSAQDMVAGASHEMAVAAGQLPDPVLKLGVDNLPVNGPDRFSITNDFMTMRRVGLMQEWTRADKRQLRAERYEREAEKTLAAKSETIAAIQRDTALAWLDCYYAEQMTAAAAEQTAQARLEIQAADSAYRAGRGSQADIFAARSALAMADDRSSKLQGRVRDARILLARWIGSAADAPLAGIPAIDTLNLDPAMLGKQLAHHPQIAVLSKQEEIAQTEAKLAEANKRADWSVEVALQQRGPAYSNMISVGVSLPLQWDQKSRQDRELSSKLAMLEQARAERDDMLRAHAAETQAMLNEWENNRERHTRYERELIPLAAERTMATIASYRGGKAGLLDLFAARRNEIDVRIQALQLRWDTARLWAQLNFLAPVNAQEAQPASIKQKALQ